MKSFQHYCCSLLQKLEEWKYRKVSSNSFVLMFHEVPHEIGEENDESITISCEAFISFITALRRMGYVFSSPEYIRKKTEEKTVYLTFDDVFLSAYTNAMAFLTREGIPFTCFIAPKLLGPEPFIGEKELQMLAKNPLCTIGAHSNSHRRLRDLSDQQILEEFTQSKSFLEKAVGKPVDIMAYPYGSRSACPPRVKRLAKEAGFRMAFSTYRIPVLDEYIARNPYFIPRINVIASNAERILREMEN